MNDEVNEAIRKLIDACRRDGVSIVMAYYKDGRCGNSWRGDVLALDYLINDLRRARDEDVRLAREKDKR